VSGMRRSVDRPRANRYLAQILRERNCLISIFRGNTQGTALPWAIDDAAVTAITSDKV
jgi:hypothetical protein